MSSFNGRRGPNGSQYIGDLNAINRDDAHASPRNFNMEEDLSMFTNTQFFDFDSGRNTDYQAQPSKVDVKAANNAPASTADEMTPATVMGEIQMEFMTNGFGFDEFATTYPAPSMNAYAEGPQNFQPLPPNHQSPIYANHVSAPAGHFPPGASSAGVDHGKAESLDSPSHSGNFEDASRHAADEDKRRRNTAASARFRIKKKQREQAMEKSAKEMSDKMSSLENKNAQLETENKWLKNLLVDKNGGDRSVLSFMEEFKTKQGKSEKTKADR